MENANVAKTLNVDHSQKRSQWKVEEKNNHKALSRQWRITLQHNMGNDNSNLNGHKNNDENKNRMAITAVAEMMKITGSQMKKLRDTVIK